MKFERGKDPKTALGIGVEALTNAVWRRLNAKSPNTWKESPPHPHFIRSWIHDTKRVAGLIETRLVKKYYSKEYAHFTKTQVIGGTFQFTKYPDFFILYDNTECEQFMNTQPPSDRIGVVTIEFWFSDKDFKI